MTRLRVDARLYHPLAAPVGVEGKKTMGRPRKWGQRMAAPQHHQKWDAWWRKGQAWVYGRMRKILYKRILCQWSVSGHEERVHAFVFEVEGYSRPWFLVTTALDLSSEQVVEAFAARSSDRKMVFGITNNAWVWRNVGLGPRSPCCARSRCRWWR